MEKEKKKLDDLTKTKLIYSGELLIFSAVFVVLGILILIGIIEVKDWKRVVFTWVTLFGGFILIGDLVWLLLSPKRRKKNSLIDKILVIPSSLFLIAYDIYSLTTDDVSLIQYAMGGVFCYLGAVYIFEAVYHWFHIHPALLEIEAGDEKPETAEEPHSESNDEKEE